MKKESKREMVNHPDHYNSHPSGVECIDVIEHMLTNPGLVFKHIWRAGEKHSEKLLEDLEKAEFYLKREIERQKKYHKKYGVYQSIFAGGE